MTYQLQYKPVGWFEEIVNHLKNLNDVAKLFSEKLTPAFRINIDSTSMLMIIALFIWFH